MSNSSYDFEVEDSHDRPTRLEIALPKFGPPAPVPMRVTTLRALGAASTGGLREFHRHLAAALETTPPRIVVDMSEVAAMDSSMLSLLITALRTCRERGGDMRLCAFQPEVRLTMDYLRMDSVFKIHESEVDARNQLELAIGD